MRKIILVLALAALTACSTTPVDPATAREVPADKAFEQQPSTVPVTVVRDSGMVAGACSITTFINGKKVAELETKEKVKAFVKPGAIIVGAGFMGKGLCSGAPRKEREFVVQDGQPRTLRVFIDQSGNVDILPTTLN
ncbi:hypothetical protein A9G83_000670 [Salmonella enterica subsp. enterica serovar Sundsvall]|nr:hypothetical protein [Salmonella enterica subsp. enterica serovar Sundsvall]